MVTDLVVADDFAAGWLGERVTAQRHLCKRIGSSYSPLAVSMYSESQSSRDIPFRNPFRLLWLGKIIGQTHR